MGICSGDLWAAGIESVAATMTWAIVYLLNYPDIQLKFGNKNLIFGSPIF